MALRPIECQDKVFNYLIKSGLHTEYGKVHGFSDINNAESFRQIVPLSDYGDLHPYITRMMKGDPDVLWPGRITFFAKSSGTTTGRSKYIPVPIENLRKNHLGGTWDALALLYNKLPDIKVFAKKSLGIGGFIESNPEYPSARVGDISALMANDAPFVAKNFYLPSRQNREISDWETKLNAVAAECIGEDVVLFGGVPTWYLVLFEKMMKMARASNMSEIWPNAQAYFHGGVGFGPYLKQFQELFPNEDFVLQEAYNASEGMFAQQDRRENIGMLLLLDHFVYYEFIPWNSDESLKVINLKEVKLGQTYSLVISTNSGLWRYQIGDLVEFTSLKPYRIRVVGRTSQCINACGEELMLHNVESALEYSCGHLGVSVADFTIAPQFLDKEKKLRHIWVVEFKSSKPDLGKFASHLDNRLRELNSDYDAKRSGDLFLQELKIHSVEPNLFNDWLKQRGSLSGQSKVPRMTANMDLINQLLSISRI